MKPRPVSRKLLMRLPLYLNYLNTLPEDTENISATTIAKALGFGDVQVRKDLAEASPAGRGRIGRPREKLIRDIANYLAFTKSTGAVVIGTGQVGLALMDYTGFADYGLNILAGFDLVSPVSGNTEGGCPIYSIGDLESFCRSHNIKLGIIAVPEKAAQRACDALVASGIVAIWNFTPAYLIVPPHVLVQSDDLASSFFLLRNRLRHALAEGADPQPDDPSITYQL